MKNLKKLNRDETKQINGGGPIKGCTRDSQCTYGACCKGVCMEFACFEE
ncbi:bacteriocin-like protein [Chryseobacterium sp. M5A1_1a]